jgi:hypothetical protein
MKTAKITGFILVLLVCFTVICGCKEKKAGNPSGNGDEVTKSQEEITEGTDVKYRTFPGLDAETEKRILQDYGATYGGGANDIWISIYCGTYNGVVAVKFKDFWYANILSGEDIAGLQFYYPTPILAWENGVLYQLRDAYDSGLFTDDDVKSIHRMYYAESTDDEYADFIGGNNHD